MDPLREAIASEPAGHPGALEAPTAVHHCLAVAFRPPFWALAGDHREEVVLGWLEVLRGPLSAVHAYQTTAAGTTSDLMIWTAAPLTSPDAPAALLRLHARALSPLREFLEPTVVLWGLTRPSPYSRRTGSDREMDAFGGGRARYLVAYPFAKTSQWFLLDPHRRRELMGQHIQVGRRHPEVRQLLLYSFGIQDQEWVVMYEMEDLGAFSALVHELRFTGARAFTLRDTPVQVGVHLEHGREGAPWR